jgi:hypothetical protein
VADAGLSLPTIVDIKTTATIDAAPAVTPDQARNDLNFLGPECDAGCIFPRGRNEPIAPPRYRLVKTGICSGIAESIT